MKKFEFALEPVLRLKVQHEQAAELRLARAVQAEHAARQHADAVRAQLAQAAGAMADSAGVAGRVADWLGQVEHAERLAVALRTAEVRLEQARQELGQARSDRIRLGTEVEALRSLRQEQWTAFRRDLARREQARLDEISMRRHAPNGTMAVPEVATE